MSAIPISVAFCVFKDIKSGKISKSIFLFQPASKENSEAWGREYVDWRDSDMSTPTVLRHEIEHALDYERGGEYRITPSGHRAHGGDKKAELLKNDSAFTYYDHDNFSVDYLHRALVHDAVREGRPVPHEVLADYPDLQKNQTGSAHAPSETTAKADTGGAVVPESPEIAKAREDLEAALSAALVAGDFTFRRSSADADPLHLTFSEVVP